MKIIIALTAIAFTLAVSGCMVTGSLEYQDPENPALTGRIGVSQNIDGKTIKRLRGN